MIQDTWQDTIFEREKIVPIAIIILFSQKKKYGKKYDEPIFFLIIKFKW